MDDRQRSGIIAETQTALMGVVDLFTNKRPCTEGASTGKCEFALDSKDDKSKDRTADETEKEDVNLIDDSDFWENGQHFPEEETGMEDRAEEVVLKGQMFVRPTCNKELKRKDNMRRYEQLLHNRPNGGKHQCGKCGQVFGNLSTMKVHCKRLRLLLAPTKVAIRNTNMNMV